MTLHACLELYDERKPSDMCLFPLHVLGRKLLEVMMRQKLLASQMAIDLVVIVLVVMVPE